MRDVAQFKQPQTAWAMRSFRKLRTLLLLSVFTLMSLNPALARTALEESLARTAALKSLVPLDTELAQAVAQYGQDSPMLLPIFRQRIGKLIPAGRLSDMEREVPWMLNIALRSQGARGIDVVLARIGESRILLSKAQFSEAVAKLVEIERDVGSITDAPPELMQRVFRDQIELLTVTGEFSPAVNVLEKYQAHAKQNFQKSPLGIPEYLELASSFYDILGRYDLAIEAQRTRLDFFQTFAGRTDHRTLRVQISLAMIYRKAGNNSEAATLLKDVIDIIGRPPYSGRAEVAPLAFLLSMMETALRTGNMTELLRWARDRGSNPLEIERSQGILDVGDDLDLEKTVPRLIRLATELHRADRSREALGYLQRAYILATNSPDLPIFYMAGVCIGLSQVQLALGQREEAILWGKLAVTQTERLRTQTTGLNLKTRQAFDQKVTRPYESLANLLIEEGRIEEAERVLSLLRQRELSELLPGKPDVKANDSLSYSPSERQAVDDLSRIVDLGAAAFRELGRVSGRRSLDQQSAEDSVRIALQKGKMEQSRSATQDYLHSMSKNLRDGPRGKVDTMPVLKLSNALRRNLSSDPNAMGLLYSVSTDRTGVIIISALGARGFILPYGQNVLAPAVSRMRASIESRSDTSSAAKELWQMLVSPILPKSITERPHTLVLGLTGVLRYLPFAALQAADGHFLIEDYALSIWVASGPDVSATPVPRPWEIAGFGVTQRVSGYDALPGVRKELQDIILTPETPTGLLPGSISLDENFSKSAFVKSLGGSRNVIHIASHFVFSANHPEKSKLILGDGTSIELQQLDDLDYANVDQMTLSACDSGLGSDLPVTTYDASDGAEVQGLASVVTRKGAKAVLASLWKVQDDSTAQLMRRFYAERRLGDQVNRAEALRRAQLALLRGKDVMPGTPEVHRSAKRVVDASASDLRSPPSDLNLPWSHPYFWAPFVLSGNWQ